MKYKKVLIPVGILIVGFIVMQVLFSFKKSMPKKKQQVRVKMMEAQRVELQPVSSLIVAYGRLTSAQPVVLSSEVAGILMTGSVPFQPAQSFKKGDLLIKVDDRQTRLDLNSAKSDLLTALASVLPEIKVDFPDEYEQFLNYFNNCSFKSSCPALPETSNQKIKLFLSRFNVYKLFFTVKNLEIKLEKHYFYAPFNGTITAADLRIGSSVRSGSRLGEVINLDNMEVEAPVPAHDIQWIDLSKPVELTSSEIAGTWTGRITRIGNDIDDRTQTVQVFISMDNNQIKNLYNGIFLEARIPGRVVDRGFPLARKAIYNENNVYLIKNGRLKFQEVDIARREKNSVIIRGGIQSGDTIVVELLQGVSNGMRAQALLNDDNSGGR